LPINEIIKCDKIGLTSGASAPEKLVQEFITKIKIHSKVKIEEFEIIKENVTFKLPGSLN
jgi:4-hydroxy-3-methylbut-2-enyl diphosphate reductase